MACRYGHLDKLPPELFLRCLSLQVVMVGEALHGGVERLAVAFEGERAGCLMPEVLG